MTAMLNAEMVYRDADLVVIAASTDYDPQENIFDASAVKTVIQSVI